MNHPNLPLPLKSQISNLRLSLLHEGTRISRQRLEFGASRFRARRARPKTQSSWPVSRSERISKLSINRNVCRFHARPKRPRLDQAFR
jgi:hypothetical protein